MAWRDPKCDDDDDHGDDDDDDGDGDGHGDCDDDDEDDDMWCEVTSIYWFAAQRNEMSNVLPCISCRLEGL